MFRVVVKLSDRGSRNRGFIRGRLKSFVSFVTSLESIRPSIQWVWHPLYPELQRPKPKADFSTPFVEENKKGVSNPGLRGEVCLCLCKLHSPPVTLLHLCTFFNTWCTWITLDYETSYCVIFTDLAVPVNSRC